MTPRTERALIRLLLYWFEMYWHDKEWRGTVPPPLPQEYLDLENEVK